MKRIIFIKLYPTSKRRMLLSENLPQTSKFFYTDISAIAVTFYNSVHGRNGLDDVYVGT